MYATVGTGIKVPPLSAYILSFSSFLKLFFIETIATVASLSGAQVTIIMTKRMTEKKDFPLFPFFFDLFPLSLSFFSLY